MASRSLFKQLSRSVYLAEPASTLANGAADGARKGPQMVLILSWMDAQLKHVEKYAETYRKLYPSSTLLVVRSNQRDFWQTAAFAKTLSPAVDVLRKGATYPAGPSSRLLVHTFSNGGCLTLKQLNELLRSSPSSANGSADSEPLLKKHSPGIPARAFVFDSCPGLSTLSSTMAAFTAPIKSAFLRYPAMAVVAMVYGVLRLYGVIFRKTPVLQRLSDYLNSPALPSVPRLYLYSPSDLLIRHTDVEKHTALARSVAGVQDVRLEKFEGTAHVAHARKEGERYWSAVQRLWEESGVVKQ
ncbi:hypothetical protein RTG_01033 [Rhodotorula toruloides ATCC 204091]|uniref:Indole-diterpene biosynthesis protein PaxU n=2 Tax=Rhodotorula toruloides TaxID=5286 RepID=A0A2T0ABJ5_RHOTO|nr:hypothetical protein RTG_01033 [Rhodotorula toruloides ATCC 204091]KAK4334573.1 hypothetical protein RTBOTA2_003302 [Rhodotorula toruloides]PRQ75374.1 Eukaryotic protein of unknown function (DUF829)-domain containing protein [Rhodotorula toruloides]